MTASAVEVSSDLTLLSVGQAVQLLNGGDPDLGVKGPLLYEAIALGQLKAVRLGAAGWTIRILKKDLVEWLESRRSSAERPIKPTVGPKPRNKAVRSRSRSK